MNTAAPLLLAEVGRPLFGSPWLALGVVLIGVALLMVAIAAVGRWLAATHPEPARPAAAPMVPALPVASGPPPHVTAIIAAVVATALGRKARIIAVQPAPPSVEMLMQQWSLEGRRQIYTSHQIR